jgi:site-specific DNA recombinase
MAQLDGLVVENVKEHLFGSDRLARILEALIGREGAKDQAVQKRRSALEAEIAGHDDRLKRLYRAIEEGIVDLDDDLKERIRTLKHERGTAQAALDRIAVQSRAGAEIAPIRLEAF